MQSVNRITQQTAIPRLKEPPQPAERAAAPASASPPVADRVEISYAATQAAPPRAVEDAALAARISALRAEINAGSYVSEEKLDVVVERLLAELRGSERR